MDFIGEKTDFINKKLKTRIYVCALLREKSKYLLT